MALSIRYQQVTGEPELEAEVPWLKDVQRHLYELGQGLPPIARSHLSRLVREYVDKTITEVDARLRGRYRSGAGPDADREQDAD